MTALTLPNVSEQRELAARVAPARKASVIGASDGLILDGDALAREVVSAVMSVPAARKLAGSRSRLTPEGEALTQAVLIQIWARYRPITTRRGSPAEVLAHIARCERDPDAARIMEARQGVGVARDRIGRTLLVQVVKSTLAQRADWQDTASQYRTRAMAQKRTAPMIVATQAITPTADDAPTDTFTLSLDRYAAQGAPTAPLNVESRDVRELAERVGEILSADHSAVVARQIVAALVQAATNAFGGDVSEALRDLASEQGRTLNAVAIDATRGSKHLSEGATEVPTEVLLDAIRTAARSMPGLTAAATHDRVSWEHLPEGARDAAEVVAKIARIGGAWDPASIHTERGLPDWPDDLPMPDAAPFPGLRRGYVGTAPKPKSMRVEHNPYVTRGTERYMALSAPTTSGYGDDAAYVE